jgi:predicted ATPase
LGSRAFDILVALSDRAGEVVSQRELIGKVWPNVFVEDVSLRVHVAALRKALDCDGTRFLANVSGRGYSLLAPVSRTVIEETPEPDSAVEPAYPLPPPLARIVGRDENVREIRGKLLSRKFLTIVGSGGVGKTTAALATAHSLLGEFLGAVCFVELGPVGSPQFLAVKIMSAFGLPVQAQDPVPELIEHLRRKRVLLVLDGCEHLITEAAMVAERLFRGVTNLHILATSREALRAEGEYVHPLPPLISPPEDVTLTAAEALAYPAIQLFFDRLAGAGFGDVLSNEDARIVGDMCRQLGGIALAIELAAGRAATCGIRDTASLLKSRFALLWPGRRTAPARQQTLYATLDWSYNLLSDTERTVLRRLSVFAGSFTAEAAQEVARGDLELEEVVEAIGRLLEKFLASIDPSDPCTRYRLLDTTRAYASRKLEEAGECELVRRNHALYYCELLRATSANERGTDKAAASAMDLDDVRAALRWAFGKGGDALLGADIAAFSAPLWLGRALLTECRVWMEKAASVSCDAKGAPTQQQLRIQIAFASTELFTSGFTGNTIAAWTKTLERAQALGDKPAQLMSYLVLWGGEIRAARYLDALDTAKKCAALANGSSDAGTLAMGEWMVGHSKHHLARFAEAREHLLHGLQIDTEAARFASTKETGYDRRIDAFCILSNTLWMLGKPDAAKAWENRALAEAKSLGFTIPIGLAMSWALLNGHLSEPDYDVVERDAVELLEQSRMHSIDSDAGFALCIMGLCQAKRGQFGAGARLVAEGLRVLVGAQMEAFSALIISHTCEAAISADRTQDALFWISQLRSADHDQEHWCSSEILRVRGLLAFALDSQDDAEAHFRNAVRIARQQGALSWELRSTISLNRLMLEQQREKEALDALEAVYAQFNEGHSGTDLLAAKRQIEELRIRLRVPR